MIQFILGMITGSVTGVIVMCLCITAGEADRQMGLK